MSDVDKNSANTEIPDNAQDLTIFVQNLLEQMVGEVVQIRQSKVQHNCPYFK
jgi:hypothetical protein